MVNQFQELSSDEGQAQFQKCPFQAQNLNEKQKAGKNVVMKWVWLHLEKLISLAMLIYLVILIINLLSCKDSFLTFWLDSNQLPPKGILGQVNRNIDLSDQKSQTLSNNLLKVIMDDSTASHQQIGTKIASNEQKGSYATTPSPSVKSVEVKQKEKNQGLKQVNLQKEIKASNFAILNTAGFSKDQNAQSAQQNLKNKEYENFLLQFQSNKQTKYKQKLYGSIHTIYEELSDHQHLSLHALPSQNFESVISKSKLLSNHSLILSLLTENSQFNPSVTEKDQQYLNYLTKNYLTQDHAEQPLCAILNTRNNAFNKQIIKVLNSIYNQHYSSFEVVIADRSTDRTLTIVNNYLKTNDLASKTKIINIQHDSESFSTWKAAQQCKQGSYAIYLDGNTQLLGKQVFKMFNFYFSEYKANIVFGDHFSLDVAKEQLNLFRSKSYDESEIFMLAYRTIPRKYGRIMGFRTTALNHLPEGYIEFNRRHFQYSGIDSLAVSMLQLSCGKIKNINQPLGLALIDSTIEERQKNSRIHETKQISQKLKIDIC